MSEEPRKSGSRKWIGCCCGGLVISALICLGAAYWGGSFLKAFFPELLAELIHDVAEDSGLPPDQIASLEADVDRLRSGVEDGKVDWEEIAEFFQGFDDEPLLALIAIQAFDASVLEPSELPPEEKEAAHRSVQRFARGLQEGSIPLYRGYDLFGIEHSQEVGGGDVDIRVERTGEQWATPDDIRATVAEAERLADEAGVPDEPYQLDVATEFRRMVDELVD